MTFPTDPESQDKEKQRLLNRLRRVEGQVRGLQKMIEEERPCQDILTLLSGVRSALDAAGEAIFEHYLHTCMGDHDEGLPTAEILRAARLLR
ncbi:MULTISPECIES: metal-sensitive transcriptional regulator [Deinococcus]|uniref:Copper-sensing transcriptional repressor CsoR n=1 Tax=Deinococcus geothermalis (strain DSM 11300 / CIP 105573 / AG-3a) TaxID=319795 RepID=Q1J325_DEIGD|nr:MULTISPECIES: metal-sensitive transcriptional regulator [Deinococcus]ABF44109.1 hypothetical protein Dgeo_2676 [Deinococcus geothermalis DSM 11300]MBI0446265.1 transcriptional regulator [Deinococcus sp. DB0503]TDE86187.1 transcriptional regulator [Deinococcus sp. S9]